MLDSGAKHPRCDCVPDALLEVLLDFNREAFPNLTSGAIEFGQRCSDADQSAAARPVHIAMHFSGTFDDKAENCITVALERRQRRFRRTTLPSTNSNAS
jgi:hypothetical protein